MHSAINQAITAQQLTDRFARNFAFLQAHYPDLAQKMSAYQPSLSHLGIDDSGHANLTCATGWLYPDQVEHHIEKQVNHFFSAPNMMTIKLHQNRLNLERQLSRTEKAHEKIRSLHCTDTNPITSMPALIILGIGLGHHLMDIVTRTHMLHLMLYEPHPDFFYGALFIMDLPLIYNTFKNAGGRTFNLCVGVNSLEQVLTPLQNLAFANIWAQIYVYSHYQHHAISDGFKALSQQYRASVRQPGFIEDELCSAKHSWVNFHRHSLLQKNTTPIQSIAVLIASGPSVDAMIPMIAKLQKNCVIFSSSSSLQVCLNNNIVPDFHVEVERTDSTLATLKKISDLSPLKQVHLLTLNNTHPELPHYFGEATYALKTADLGTDLLTPRNEQLVSLENANPTSGNGALAFAVAMGFEQIILIGFDCGYSDLAQHHSQDSVYFTHSGYQDAWRSEVQVENYHGALIHSSNLLFHSKLVLERAILHNPTQKVFNTGTGAVIKNAVYLENDRLENMLNQAGPQSIQKRQSLSKMAITTEELQTYHMKWSGIDTSFNEWRQVLQHALNTTNKPMSQFEVMSCMSDIQAKLANIVSRSPFPVLFKGECHNMALTIGAVLGSSQAADVTSIFHQTLKIYLDLITGCQQQLSQDLAEAKNLINAVSEAQL